ncbi:MAG TPA: polysaccharide biosynthesis tyrosine autokinase [Candidatus Polarisedimenticolaceae bacterium]
MSSHAADGSANDPTLRRRGLEYWSVLLQRRWVVLASVAVVVATTMIATFFAEPEFEATTTLQIDRQGPDILTFRDVVGVDPSYAAYQDFYQTQYRILESRSVLRLAAERLDLPNLPSFATRRPSPIARFVAWLKSPLGDDDATAADPLLPSIRFLEARMRVRPVRNSQLVQLIFTDRDPVLARDAANAVAEAYLQFNYDKRYGTAAIAREFLTKEVARVQGEIGDLERRLQEYSTKKELLSLSQGTEDISQQALASMNESFVQARTRLAIARARWESVRNAPPESLPEVLNSPLIQHLRQQYAEIERKHTLLAERFLPGWPALQELEGELAQARERLEIEQAGIARQVRATAEAEYGKARGEVEGLEAQVVTQKTEVQRVNRAAIEFASLRSEIDNKRKVLGDLVARQSQTQSSERLKDTGTSNVRIVDLAEVPERPVRPRKSVNLALALLLGTALGVGMAILLDYLDNAVKSELDILRVTKLPVLGHVPRFRSLRLVEGDAPAPDDEPAPATIDLASHADPRSTFAEAFKNLRTSILLASPERPPRHIVVTSCEPQDGKSTVATNLAIVLTQQGKRVLLVDADLRRPRLHRSFGIGNEAGLSNVLSGNAEAAEVVQTTEVPGLSLVCSGPIPPNPSELLGSPALATFLRHADEDLGFDHVILDTPPIASVTDPVLLSSSLDATIVVVRAGKTSREALAHSVERLKHSRARVAGAVLNAITDEIGSYYYGRYRYESGSATESDAPSTSKRLSRRFRRHARSSGRT